MSPLRKSFAILLPLCMALLAACHPSADTRQDFSTQEASTQCIDSIFHTFRQDTTRAYAMLDSALAKGTLSHFDADFTRSRLYLLDNASPIRARLLLERLLRQDDLTAHQRLLVLEQLVYAARLRTDDLGLLGYGMQLVDLCRQEGDEVRMLAVQAQMGTALVRLGRTDEGFAKVDDAIARLQRGNNLKELDAYIKATKSKVTALDELDRFDELIPLARNIVAKLDDFEANPDKYGDYSSLFASANRRSDYIDFYRGQAYSIIAYAHATMGRMDSARHYLALFEQTDFSQSLNGKMMASSTWCSLGMFDRMLTFYDELLHQWGDDTMHHDYAVMLHNRAIAAGHRGHSLQCLNYMQRYSELMMHLGDMERQAQAQDYAARYHEQEQQLTIDREQTRLRNTRHTVAGVALLLVVAIVFIAWLLQQQSAIQRKNKLLVEQISEVVRMRNMTSTPLEQTKPMTPVTPDMLPPQPAKHGGQALPSSAVPTRAKAPSAMDDNELFDFLSGAIRREQLYTDPTFGRQTLLDRYHVNERRIGAAFAQAGSLPDYVRELRLAHACSLLAERTEMSIGEVASASGFSSLTVFGREFKRRYDITPTFYRQQTASQRN